MTPSDRPALILTCSSATRRSTRSAAQSHTAPTSVRSAARSERASSRSKADGRYAPFRLRRSYRQRLRSRRRTIMSSCPLPFNPLIPPQRENPYPVYAQAREEAPVFFSPLHDAWVVTRYEDVVAI